MDIKPTILCKGINLVKEWLRTENHIWCLTDSSVLSELFKSNQSWQPSKLPGRVKPDFILTALAIIEDEVFLHEVTKR